MSNHLGCIEYESDIKAVADNPQLCNKTPSGEFFGFINGRRVKIWNAASARSFKNRFQKSGMICALIALVIAVTAVIFLFISFKVFLISAVCSITFGLISHSLIKHYNEQLQIQQAVAVQQMIDEGKVPKVQLGNNAREIPERQFDPNDLDTRKKYAHIILCIKQGKTRDSEVQEYIFRG